MSLRIPNKIPVFQNGSNKREVVDFQKNEDFSFSENNLNIK
jgi:hypothetical protein